MDVTGANIGSSELYGCTMGVPVFAERNRDDGSFFYLLCVKSSFELYGCTMGVPVFAERNRDDGSFYI